MNYIKNWHECVQHVLACYPEEAGGLIDNDNVFHPIDNIAEDKLTAFEMDPREIIGFDLKCFLHSHPFDPHSQLVDDVRIPSKQDLETQIALDCECAIVVTEGENVMEPIFWGDFDHRPDLWKREFIHSAQDCLSFVADWHYAHTGFKMPAFARDFDWFTHGNDFIVQQLKKHGFVDVTDGNYKRGDLVVYKIDSTVANHLGVIIEPGRVGHQLFSRFPKAEPFAKWAKYIQKVVRHASSTVNTKE